MRILDWRIGVWFLVLGLIGILLPTFDDYTPAASLAAIPGWLYYILVAAGSLVIGIGIYTKLKNR